MHYFAGLFDAEGYVSVCPKGSFTIAVEMANEQIPNLFKDFFKGGIYQRKRENRKKTWTWKINSISEQALYFINSISPYSIIKQPQLKRLKDYLDQPRKDRKLTRSITVSTIKDFKQPSPMSIEDIRDRHEKLIEPHFFKWFAGFFDGDGNLVCNQYTDNRNGKKYFSHQIAVANICPMAICHILDRINGSVSQLNRPVNPIFKWTCARHNEKFLCKSIYPFLKIKPLQMERFMEFITNPPIEQKFRLIQEIKHLNSL